MIKKEEAKTRAQKSNKKGRRGFIPSSLPNYILMSATKPNINALRSHCKCLSTSVTNMHIASMV